MFDDESWLCRDKCDDLTCYLEALRGGFLPDVITFVGAGTGRGLGIERERVPGSSPWLAIEVTCRRISSMEVDGLVRAGSWRPKTSHRILVFVMVRLPLREVLLLPQEDEIFIVPFLSFSR